MSPRMTSIRTFGGNLLQHVKLELHIGGDFLQKEIAGSGGTATSSGGTAPCNTAGLRPRQNHVSLPEATNWRSPFHNEMERICTPILPLGLAVPLSDLTLTGKLVSGLSDLIPRASVV
ncbi:hypothetical protein SESBI_20553 [Sesbania bispinosa]|nr:hypothetical protein SESBI_20553 [Sesbania bispinosa]